MLQKYYLVRHIGDFLTLGFGNGKGILYADATLPRNNEFRFNGNSLTGLKRQLEPLRKNRQFIQFKTDAVADEFGLFTRHSHEIFAESARFRHGRRQGKKFLADSSRFKGPLEGTLNFQRKFECPL